MLIEIKNRWTRKVVWSGEAPSLRKANLRGADLTDANLRGADLAGANLRDAVLRDADLTGADLTDADLTGADLAGANLRDANLRGADLTDADLRSADLRGADLAKLKSPPIPIVPDIDKAVIAACTSEGCKLDMNIWHAEEPSPNKPCGTTHCRAGWAIHLAGKAGYELEAKVGACAAGALIYAVSRPNKPVPDFYADDKSAMKDLKACAAE